jgi:hypothetical protein
MKFLRFIFNEFDYSYYYNKKYLINTNTREVHKLISLENTSKFVVEPNCTKNMAEKNKRYASQYDLIKYMEKYPDANGCAKCYNEIDTDELHTN